MDINLQFSLSSSLCLNIIFRNLWIGNLKFMALAVAEGRRPRWGPLPTLNRLKLQLLSHIVCCSTCILFVTNGRILSISFFERTIIYIYTYIQFPTLDNHVVLNYQQVLETARQVASLPVNSTPIPYDQVTNQCEALVTGKQQKMSVLHSFTLRQEGKALVDSHENEKKSLNLPNLVRISSFYLVFPLLSLSL